MNVMEEWNMSDKKTLFAAIDAQRDTLCSMAD